jgi:hypothetical protein
MSRTVLFNSRKPVIDGSFRCINPPARVAPL